MVSFFIKIRVKGYVYCRCTTTYFDHSRYPPIPIKDSRNKQSNYKRFMFSQSPKYYSNRNSKHQVLFLTHLFSPNMVLVEGPTSGEICRDAGGILPVTTLMSSMPMMGVMTSGGCCPFFQTNQLESSFTSSYLTTT